jgi:hypothetical protein
LPPGCSDSAQQRELPHREFPTITRLLCHQNQQTLTLQCGETGFCNRLRKVQPRPSLYVADLTSFTSDGKVLTFDIVKTTSGRPLRATIIAHDMSVSIEIKEKPWTGPHLLASKPDNWDDHMDGLYEAPQMTQPLRTRFSARDALDGDIPPIHHTMSTNPSAREVTLSFSWGRVHVSADPFRIDLTRGDDDTVVASFNKRGLFRYEHFSRREDTPLIEREEDGTPNGYEIASAWDERNKGTADASPYGPSAIAADVEFPSARALYGLPERALPLDLPDTTGGEPLRLYNLDVFEYETNHRMGLYGAVPFVQAMGMGGGGGSVGALWLNAAETFVDVSHAADGRSARFMSETGDILLHLFGGPTALDVSAQLTAATGRGGVPPLFSLGYHQCRWNYKDEADVAAVDDGFERHRIPYDVLWLDIGETGGGGC